MKSELLHIYYANNALRKRCLLVIILLLTLTPFFKVGAQDPVFTQFYANPLYLNPALAGTGECGRVMFNYRNQWPSIAKGFRTYSLSADRYSDFLSGGVGLLVSMDQASEVINTLRASGIYSYHLRLSETAQLNAGFEASFHQQQLKWENLIFADMIDPLTGSVIHSQTLEVPPENQTIRVFDFSGGLVLGIAQKFYFGVAAHHLTQPELGYYYNQGVSPFEIKYTAHAGGNIVLHEGSFRSEKGKLELSPFAIYQRQQQAQQITAGTNISLYPITLGVWYRYSGSNPDGLAFLVGFKQGNYKLGYSYDLTLSKIGRRSGGAHEISFTLLICTVKRNKSGAIKCPEF